MLWREIFKKFQLLSTFGDFLRAFLGVFFTIAQIFFVAGRTRRGHMDRCF